MRCSPSPSGELIFFQDYLSLLYWLLHLLWLKSLKSHRNVDTCERMVYVTWPKTPHIIHSLSANSDDVVREQNLIDCTEPTTTACQSPPGRIHHLKFIFHSENLGYFEETKTKWAPRTQMLIFPLSLMSAMRLPWSRLPTHNSFN